MASAVYPKALEAFLGSSISMSADTIKCCLVDTGTYTYSAAHQFRSSLTGVAGGTHATLGSKTVTNGIFDAADTTMVAVTAGASVEAAVLYKDTGNIATDPLIAYIEFSSITPNGGDIVITWQATAPNIFQL